MANKQPIPLPIQYGIPSDLTGAIPHSDGRLINHFPGDPALAIGYEIPIFLPGAGKEFILTRGYCSRVSNGIQQWRNGNAGFGLFDGPGGTEMIVGPDEPWDSNDPHWPTNNGRRIKNGLYARRVRAENDPNGNGDNHERTFVVINGFVVDAAGTVPTVSSFTPQLIGLDYSDAVSANVTLLGSGWLPGQSRTVYTPPAGKDLILQSFELRPGPNANQTVNPDFANLRDGTRLIQPWQFLRRGRPIHSAGGILIRESLQIYLQDAGTNNTRDHEVSYGGYLIDTLPAV